MQLTINIHIFYVNLVFLKMNLSLQSWSFQITDNLFFWKLQNCFRNKTIDDHMGTLSLKNEFQILK
jgi:hypothetical protein